MKSFLLSCVSIAFLVFASLQATYSQTIIPGGNVSGTWTAAGSPYLVQGNIEIQADSTLTIEPGVEVTFQANYYLTVNGWLQAVGTETDSIHFSAVTTWTGLFFSNAPDSSHLEYCSISGSSWAGLQCTNSNPVITSCRISHNVGLFHGGIVLGNSNARITQCDISNNQSNENGGGITITNSSPEISYCNITGNSSNNGGGIYATGGNPMISNCTVSDNSANWGGGISFMGGGHGIITDCFVTSDTAEFQGGGIYISTPGGVVNINNSTIYNCTTNSTTSQGGGIYISPADTVSIVSTIIDSNYVVGSVEPYGGGAMFSGDCNHLVLNHCDVVNNRAVLNFGGIMLYGNTNITVKNSIFRHQLGFHIYFYSYTSAAVSYSDFYDSWTYPPFENPPAGLGTITQVNANGDSCDVFYNIYLDPLFVDFPNGDYHLSWANWPAPDSTKSPCIDAGDPLSPLDPDSTITDMGMFSFNQSVPVELVSFTAELNEYNVILNWATATETNNNGFEIERKQDISGWEKIGFIKGNGTTTEPNSYSFTDKNISTGIYLYRLKQINYDGSFEYSIGIKVEAGAPLEFLLEQNYPNPFNPSTKIKYSVPQSSIITIKVFDVLGNEIKTLVNEEEPAGTYDVELDGSRLPSGVYFYQLHAGSYIDTKKMILLK